MPVRAWRFKSSHPHRARPPTGCRSPASQFPRDARASLLPPSARRLRGGLTRRRQATIADAPPGERDRRSSSRSRRPRSPSRRRRCGGAPDRCRAAPLRGGRSASSFPCASCAGATGSSRTASRSSSARATCRASAGSRACDTSTRPPRTAFWQGPDAATIRARELPGPRSRTRGPGMKIGIIDDGVDQRHRFFDPSGYAMPEGFPKGQVGVHDREGDRRPVVPAARRDVAPRVEALRPRALEPRNARRGNRRGQRGHAGGGRPHQRRSRRARISGTTRR